MRLTNKLLTCAFSFLALQILHVLPAQAADSAAPAQSTATALPPITIYHLEARRSERIVWLMEELGFPYELKFVRGNLGASLALIRERAPDLEVDGEMHGDAALDSVLRRRIMPRSTLSDDANLLVLRPGRRRK